MGVRLDQERPGHWSTDFVDQRRALAYWVDTVCDRFLELDIDTPVRSHFRACLDQIDFGPATLSFVGAASQRIRRTPARISRTRYPTFFLLQFRVGHGLLRQRSKEVRAHAGECVLINGTEPYELDCPQSTSAAILRMPEDWLRRAPVLSPCEPVTASFILRPPKTTCRYREDGSDDRIGRPLRASSPRPPFLRFRRLPATPQPIAALCHGARTTAQR